MSFVVTLIALLVERFFDWSHIRNWNWYLSLQRRVSQKLVGKAPALILAATIVPLALVIALLHHLLLTFLYGFGVLVFDLLILLYCLGPHNLWADIFSSTNALNQTDANAAEKLKVTFGLPAPRADAETRRSLVNNIFIAANHRVLAVIFWYLIAGPVGAVVYRAVSISGHAQTTSEVTQTALTVEAYLDWLPARFFTFLFALGGHFTQVFSCWTKRLPQGIHSNDAILTECGMAALGIDNTAALALDGSVEKSAVSLLDRTLVILVVIVAIMVLLTY